MQSSQIHTLASHLSQDLCLEQCLKSNQVELNTSLVFLSSKNLCSTSAQRHLLEFQGTLSEIQTSSSLETYVTFTLDVAYIRPISLCIPPMQV